MANFGEIATVGAAAQEDRRQAERRAGKGPGMKVVQKGTGRVRGSRAFLRPPGLRLWQERGERPWPWTVQFCFLLDVFSGDGMPFQE